MSPPPPLRVLISGAGIAGPALALNLSRLPSPLKCTITIVERHPDLRASGQQIDLRGQGVVAMRKLGIEPQVRAVVVDEPGVRILNRKGKTQAYFGSNKTGKGAQSFSAEWEIMRGDLCRVLYDATVDLPGVRYVFGTTVETFEHVKGGKAVKVKLSDGSEEEYDLLVGCDGVGSRVRRRMFTDGRKDGLFPAGIACAFYSIPPAEGDTPDATWCHLSGRRGFMTRRDREDCLRVYLMCAGDDEQMAKLLKHSTVAEQKEAWAEVFKHDLLDAWGIRRFIEGLHSPQADDFYAVEFAQVKLDNWSEGRVVVLGDAGFCPAPLTGQGTSLAFAGAYVLAGEIARACGKDVQEDVNPWDNVPVALAAYETELKPFVKTVQDVPVKRIVSFMCPESAWVVSLIHWAAWLIAVLRLNQLAAKFGSDDKGSWRLPDYPELSAPKS
ncbi:monooxygenase [Parachaetomium inaequale]|uniref:Monooxygenase n=1 Tax=Parachaetomium inaequale TaxID=2588326 RepID=A0AAN6PHU6_9PEZI|nr:monooxygenase [Parachaetomium inaequale]